MVADPPHDAAALRALLQGDVVRAAAGLVGCRITHGIHELVIVETEAYHQSESACHGYGGHTPRAAKLRRPAGYSYVYLSYGMHQLVNVVVESEQVAAAVLLRGAVALGPGYAADPVPGQVGAVPGPGRLGKALQVGAPHDGIDLLAGGSLRLEPADRADRITGRELRAGPRIGISKATELPWRFCLAGSKGVSTPRL